MRFLLDTHIWIWSEAVPSRLARRVSRDLDDPKNEIWLSPVSTWEVLLLARKGRLHLTPGPESWVRTALTKSRLREAALNHHVALLSAGLKLPHQDPADRFLVATALVYDLTLVTEDERLLRARCCPILANR